MVDLTLGASETPTLLPPLRQDLDLRPLGEGKTRRVIVYDPLSHKYYDLRPQSATLMSLWHLRDPAKICMAAAQLGMRDAQNALEALARFLSRYGLLQNTPEAGFAAFHAALQQEKTLRARLGSVLFYRLRLGNPEALLEWLYPLARPLMTRGFRWLSALAFVIALTFVLRRPELVTETFRQSANLQGAVGLALAIALVKLCHELGHAFQAKRLGLEVPGCGIMFMVGFPMPFTELSDSWRLHEQRDRLRVDAGGILAEMAVAAWASLAFVFWPDGAMRGILFAMAGSSLLLSLFVNLNPLMRFDGYFLLADATGIKNLQPRSTALALWALREGLFGLGAPEPEPLNKTTRRRMILYAIAVYLYRVFLTFSIAALLFVFLPKAIGVPVIALYVSAFFLAPLFKEIAQWARLLPTALGKARTWRSLVVFAGMIALLLWPFAQKVTAPARITPTGQQIFTSPPNLQLIAQPSASGPVQEGDVLWRFADSSASFQNDRLVAQITTLRTQLERAATSPALREQAPLFRSEITRLTSELDALAKRNAQMELTAPFAGTLYLAQEIAQDTAALPLGGSRTLGYLLPEAQHMGWVANGYVLADDLSALGDAPRATFRAKGLALPVLSLGLPQISRAPVERIDHPEAVQPFGGPIQTRSDAPDVPQVNVHAFTAQITSKYSGAGVPVVPGTVVFQGARKSIVARMRDRIAQVLVQEAGL